MNQPKTRVSLQCTHNLGGLGPTGLGRFWRSIFIGFREYGFKIRAVAAGVSVLGLEGFGLKCLGLRIISKL